MSKSKLLLYKNVLWCRSSQIRAKTVQSLESEFRKPQNWGIYHNLPTSITHGVFSEQFDSKSNWFEKYFIKGNYHGKTKRDGVFVPLPSPIVNMLNGVNFGSCRFIEPNSYVVFSQIFVYLFIFALFFFFGTVDLD